MIKGIRLMILVKLMLSRCVGSVCSSSVNGSAVAVPVGDDVEVVINGLAITMGI